MKRVALYVRVSTDEQKKHGLSVDNQIEALQAYAKANNYEIVGLYNDAGHTAAKSYKKRPALLELIADVQAGKINTIIFTRLDRWFRSVKEYHKVQEYLDANNVSWKTIWEDYETETANGRFKVNIMLAIAEAEAARTSEKIKSVMEYKKGRGDYVGSAPYGYVKANSSLYIDEEEQEGLRVLFDEYLQSFNVKKATQAAIEHGFKVSSTAVYMILKNPVYAGVCRNGFKAEPYITQEQFDLIQQTITKNARNRMANTGKFRNYIFNGLAYCPVCKRKMAATTYVEHRVKTDIPYEMARYRCSNYTADHKHNSISERNLEAYMVSAIDKLIDRRIKEVKMSTTTIDSAKQISALNSKLKRLAVLFEDGDIEIDEYKIKRDAIKEQIKELEKKPAEAPSRLPNAWRKVYDGLDASHKRAFWLQMLDRIEIFDKKITVFFR